MRRAVVGLARACDNACVFCGIDGLPARSGADAEALLASARTTGASEVTFTGGEPTIDPALPEAVATARRLGFERVGVQTHARHLGEGPLLAELVSRGLTDVHVSLHGAHAAVHDYHTGVAGSFDGLLAGARACRSARLDLVISTVLTRSTTRSLAEMPELLRSLGADAWCIVVPSAAGRAAKAFDRVYPRLGLALPYALHAMQAAHTMGLPAWIRGAPICGLGPFAAHAIDDEPRAYSERCDSCDARPRCPGLDAHYLARFDADELKPCALPGARSRADLDHLARMFVGPGELAPAPEVRTTPELSSPASARRALPVIGKVQPAVAEVPSSGPKRSGEALRELFPALFDEKTGR